MSYLKHKPGSIEEIVSKLRPEDSDYQAKFKKDQELLETFDKQTEVKLDTQGITDGNTSR